MVEYVNHGLFLRRFYGVPGDCFHAWPVGVEERR